MKTRRHFLTTTAAASLASSLHAQKAEAPKFEICAFIKFVQSFSHEELAKTLAQLGCDGIEATVRKGGQVEPEAVAEGLPSLVEALKKESQVITIMASDVVRADDPLMEKTLRVAASLGVKRYRMGYYRYDLNKPIRRQLDEFRPMAQELAALNKELGLQALYQNHAGTKYVGASLWDLDLLMEGIEPTQMAVGFDIRHATVEGGTTWATLWKLIEPRLGAVYVKDFVWEGRKMKNVPLGSGMVEPKFFSDLAKHRADVPFTVHVEYLEHADTVENIAALKHDLATLKKLLGIS
jgi:sugar phosphate isomerase/epimerase